MHILEHYGPGSGKLAAMNSKVRLQASLSPKFVSTVQAGV